MTLIHATTIRCDSCGDRKTTAWDNSTGARWSTRKQLGWKIIGTGRARKDYCPQCVKDGKAK